MQHDGNFVEYGPSGAVWSSSTGGTGDGASATMQADGNFVVYRSGGGATYSSSTAPSSGDRLVVQDDGNLVIYDGSGKALWARGQLLQATNKAAVDWANSRVGQVIANPTSDQPYSAHQWSGYCWQFVVKAFGGKVPTGLGSAQGGWNYYHSRGMTRTGAPPYGSIAFWSYRTDGHAAVAVGGGDTIGTFGTSRDRKAVGHAMYNNRGITYLGYVIP